MDADDDGRDQRETKRHSISVRANQECDPRPRQCANQHCDEPAIVRSGSGNIALGRRPRRAANLLYFGLDFAGVLVPLLRFLLQGPQHDFIQPHVDLDLSSTAAQAADRQLAGQQFVEHHAQRIDVGAVIDRLWSLHLFGRHVAQRAHHLLRGRQPMSAGSWPSNLARPKSAIFTRPRLSMRMFSGLMSR